MESTTTLVALPTVRGIGLSNVVDDPPAVPEFLFCMLLKSILFELGCKEVLTAA
jgi:hypothetical protein